MYQSPIHSAVYVYVKKKKGKFIQKHIIDIVTFKVKYAKNTPKTNLNSTKVHRQQIMWIFMSVFFETPILISYTYH